MKRKLVCLALSGAMLLSGCGADGDAGTARSQNLMAEVRPREAELGTPADFSAQTADFGVRLLQHCDDGKNVLVSPVSVLSALGMTANGAGGETLRQMEEVFGMTSAEVNAWVSAVSRDLPREKDCSVALANAVWLRDDPSLTVEEDFLQANADWYDAGAYKAPFDETTVADINGWVKEHTGGLIDGVLEEIPDEVMLYLVNALSFDAAWSEDYEDFQVRKGMFYPTPGSAGQETDFLYSTEGRYLTDENAQGFYKPYKGGRYAFLALLPDEGVSVDDYAAGLTGARLAAAMKDPSNEEVRVAIPSFEAEYSAKLNDTLSAMGMPDAFDPDAADLSRMGRYGDLPLFIGAVVHKTKIIVDRHGTKAAAVTMVAPAAGAPMPVEKPKQVYLDRPFVYGLVDLRTNTPLFLGIQRDLEA